MVNAVVRRQKQENKEFRVILGFIGSSRPAQDMGDPGSENRNEKKKAKDQAQIAQNKTNHIM